jgi:hypothetical protein
VVTGVSDESEGELTVYPNPSVNGQFSIRLNTAGEKIELNVFDASGRLCHHKMFNSKGKTEVIGLDLQDLKSGLYSAQIKIDGAIFSHRLSIVTGQ